jgi:hypothetical protein
MPCVTNNALMLPDRFICHASFSIEKVFETNVVKFLSDQGEIIDLKYTWWAAILHR